MNCNGPVNTYDSRTFKYDLYSSAQERNALFGYDQQNVPELQMNYHDTFLFNPYETTEPCADRVCSVETAPRDYYFNLPRNDTRVVIGENDHLPNLYDDVVRTDQVLHSKPDFYRTWKPFTTSAQNLLQGCPTQFIPHDKPVEVAPVIDAGYWTGDLNSRLYERSLINSAVEHPYVNFYNRQGMVNMLAQNMRNKHDQYTVPLSDQTFATQLVENAGIPPATVTL